MLVHVIEATTGDYEDRHSFIEKAFVDLDKATRYLSQLDVERDVFQNWILDTYRDINFYENCITDEDYDKAGKLDDECFKTATDKFLTLNQSGFDKYDWPYYCLYTIEVEE